jgi:hypothetical protein
MKTSILLSVSILVALTVRAQTPASDSVRVEVTQEISLSESAKPDTSARAQAEAYQLRELYNRSRRETTIFHVGFTGPIHFRWLRTKLPYDYDWQGLWAGVSHKLNPALSVRAGLDWDFSRGQNASQTTGTNLLGMVAIDYYPFIKRNIRLGKTANNFYDHPFVTAEYWHPFSRQTIVLDSQTFRGVPFTQVVNFGIGSGTRSNRFRWYFYNVTIVASYWINRPAEVPHAIQPMLTTTFGIGF